LFLPPFSPGQLFCRGLYAHAYVSPPLSPPLHNYPAHQVNIMKQLAQQVLVPFLRNRVGLGPLLYPPRVWTFYFSYTERVLQFFPPWTRRFGSTPPPPVLFMAAGHRDLRAFSAHCFFRLAVFFLGRSTFFSLTFPPPFPVLLNQTW